MKQLLSVLIFIIAFECANAQSVKSGWSVTPRVGVNFSDIGNKDDYLYDDPVGHYGTSLKAGFTAGVDVEYRHCKWTGTVLGISYSNEGYLIKYSEKWKEKYSFNYVGLAATESFYVSRYLAVKTGLQLGYLAGAPRSNIYPWSHSHWNLSIPVGISGEYKHVVLDLRYHFGLQDVGGYKYDGDEKCRTKSLWITLGYKFSL